MNGLTSTNNRSLRRNKRSACSWKRNNIRANIDSPPIEIINYPPGPISIIPSWNPVNRNEKPPYSYATIIGHAILTSAERKLTLHEIYVWITENYPFYTNDSQGWQNSIRHNLSLHKSFVKIERDTNANTPPRKGCYWTIKPGKEQFFIDNLQKPLNSSRRPQQSVAQLLSSHNSRRRQPASNRRTSSTCTTTPVNDKLLYSHHPQNQHRYFPSSSSYSIAALSPLNTITDTGTRATTTDFPSTTTAPADDASSRTLSAAPESEFPVVSLSSAASSSDHLSSYSSYSSSSSSPLSNSPAYQQLLCNVPETTSMSYSVYPEHNTELFGDQHNDLLYSNSYTDKDLMPASTVSTKSYHYETASSRTYSVATDHSYSNVSYPPSLSPYDSFSTTSSFPESQLLSYPYHPTESIIRNDGNSCSRSRDMDNAYYTSQHGPTSTANASRQAGYLSPHSPTAVLYRYNGKMMLPYSNASLSNNSRSPSLKNKIGYYNDEIRTPLSCGFLQQEQQSPFLMDNSESIYSPLHR